MDDLTYSSSVHSFHAQTSPSEVDNPYDHGHLWQSLDYYGIGTEIPPAFIQPGFPSSTFPGLVHVQNPTHFATPSQSPIQIGRTDSINSSVLELHASSRSESQDQSVSRRHSKDQESEPACAGQHHQSKSCELCQSDKREKRKEQNRKAQRKHRLRSEARLEQLQTKLQEQTEEIASLKEVNESLLKRIEHLNGVGGHGEPC
ncbi:hypothetical protein EDD37DRAFT_654877 [Exophiala viscosa]|nr:hypothetical protein EDD37DRAFT_654877 [Exophiala viscosa]